MILLEGQKVINPFLSRKNQLEHNKLWKLTLAWRLFILLFHPWSNAWGHGLYLET